MQHGALRIPGAEPSTMSWEDREGDVCSTHT